MTMAITCGFLFAGLPLMAIVNTAPSGTSGSPQTRECVVLLHGLGRTAWSMKAMEYFLRKQGYDVVNLSYPSTRHRIEHLSDIWLEELLQSRIPGHPAKIHFVTHSLGGIIVRQYLAKHKIDNCGRVVMLAPPNHGSTVIDRLRKSPFARVLLGAGGMELGTDPGSVPNRLGAVDFECGIIAGDRSLNPLLSSALSGPNDGKVTVASARVDGMRDFLVVRNSHTWLMWRGQTLRQTAHFLKFGKFGGIQPVSPN